jgi:hypothetical protein
MKSYTLFLHYKQGDDFCGCLKECKDNISESLSLWASQFQSCLEACNILAFELAGINVEVVADTHYIAFTPKDEEADKVFSMLEHRGIVCSEEHDDEEE